MTCLRWPTFCALIALGSLALADKPITLTIIHSNDMHAHADATMIQKKPYGGYARQATLINQLRAKEKNVLLLNAGDTFQGTLYFNVYEGLADLAYMNWIKYDAMCLGNHEFDRGPSTLANFVKGANFPVLCSNLDFSKEPALNGLVQPSTVLTVGGEKVGVVGAVTPDLFDISAPGENIKMTEIRSSVQTAVDGLTKQGINKIILLTHIGYREDQALVKQLKDVDVVVGGHSHTPLGTPSIPGWPQPGGPYPTIAKDSTGRDVPVVQGWEWAKVLGELKVEFDANGKVVRIVEAKAFPVDETVPEDKGVASLLAALMKPIASMQNSVIGDTPSGVDRRGQGRHDNPMASVVADALLASTAKNQSVAAFINAGGVRGAFDAGPITYGEAISVSPFNNTLTVMELPGSELKQVLEDGVADASKLGGLLYPSAGSSYKLDLSKPTNGRVSEVVIAGAPLNLSKTYRVTFLNFTATGGDAHVTLKNSKSPRVETGMLDIDALVDYVKAHKPLISPGQSRVTGS